MSERTAFGAAADRAGFWCPSCVNGHQSDIMENSPLPIMDHLTPHQPQIRSLTGLRFIAACSIAFGHIVPATVTVMGLPLNGTTMLGMPIFFTLSGFIIHYIYSEAFALSWRGAAADFAVARFSRIYPIYFILFLYILVKTPMGARLAQPDGLPILWAYLLGITTWLPFAIDGKLIGQWWYGISWSVSTEIFFYICYALFLYRMSRMRLRQAAIALIACILVSFVAAYLLFVTKDAWETWILARYPTLISRQDDFPDSFYRWALYFSPYAQMPCFIAGVLTCQIFLRIKSSALAARIPADTLAWGAAIGIAVVWMALLAGGFTQPWLSSTNWMAFLVTLHLNILFMPACCVLIFALVVRRTHIGAVLSVPTVVFLGEVSYSTYLGHPIATRLAGHPTAGAPVAVKVVAALVATYLLSMLLSYCVEIPAKRFLRRAWMKWAEFAT
ncbi:MAG: acyltransferase [Methylobacteriaceae bacterium]|nr:acyltransferase [Methylobacteriaceae bacterium]